MKRLITTHYSAGAFNTATLLLRIVFGILMMYRGYEILVHFSNPQRYIPNIMGIGMTASKLFVIFAEFFCALFVVIGLFTRLVVIPIIIVIIAIFMAIHYTVFDLATGETYALYLSAFITLLLVGPGKVSVDGMTGR